MVGFNGVVLLCWPNWFWCPGFVGHVGFAAPLALLAWMILLPVCFVDLIGSIGLVGFS